MTTTINTNVNTYRLTEFYIEEKAISIMFKNWAIFSSKNVCSVKLAKRTILP